MRFQVANRGKLMHEMVLGTPEELARHAREMQGGHAIDQHPHHPMSMHEVNAVQVAPGATEEMVWRFTRPGNVRFACLVPGHSEAGMVGKIAVTR